MSSNILQPYNKNEIDIIYFDKITTLIIMRYSDPSLMAVNNLCNLFLLL